MLHEHFQGQRCNNLSGISPFGMLRVFLSATARYLEPAALVFASQEELLLSFASHVILDENPTLDSILTARSFWKREDS